MMDDRSAFERQLAREVTRIAGPDPDVEPMAIVQSVATTPRAGRWAAVTRLVPGTVSREPRAASFSLFSVLKFTAAAIVLAIFGGFLLTSVTPVPPMEGPDPAAIDEPTRNARGSVWLERHETDPATFYVLHGDGLVTGLNRQLGIGVGQWAPVDDRSIVAQLGFTGIDRQYQYVPLEPDTADLRFSGELDDTGDLMTLTYEPNDLGLTSTSAERLKLAPMPPEAASVTPPDTGWRPITGTHSREPDESAVVFERYGGRPNVNLEHSDGTSVSINAHVGPGVGLMAWADEYHHIATGWFSSDDPDTTLPLVGERSIDPESGESRTRFGNSEGFTGSAPREPQTLGPDAGALPEPDPAWWPTLGSLWVEEREGGPEVTVAWHADGTLLAIDPYRGVGVGSWRPTAPDAAVVIIDYYDTDPSLEGVTPGPATLSGEVLFDDSGEVASMEYAVRNRPTDGETQEDSGTTTLRRWPFGE